jgi:hypothetical protein
MLSPAPIPVCALVDNPSCAARMLASELMLDVKGFVATAGGLSTGAGGGGVAAGVIVVLVRITESLLCC